MTVVNRTMYPLQTSMNLIAKMQDQFSELQTQLSTGQKASTLSGLGTDRFFDLSIHARMSRLNGYSDSIKMVNTRLTMFDQVTSRLSDLQASSRSLMTPSAYGSGDLNFGSVPSLAQSNLDEVVNLLNMDVGGRYLFAGSQTDTSPVAPMDALINGAAGKAGFKQVASERQQADVGDGLGRLQIGVAADTVTLNEDGTHPFGFKLSTLTASSGAVSLTPPSGSPPSLSVQFNSLPIAGDSVTVGLTLPDGTEDGTTLKAVTGTPQAGEFQIGADANATAANYKAALQSALTDKAGTTLVAASNNAAAENFFNGQGQPILRVQGPNFATATQLVTADPTTTVQWYSGSDDANARAAVSAKVDDAATVDYGAQANENGTVNLVRGLAILSIQNFSTSDPTSEGRFDAIATRNLQRMSTNHASEPGSIQMLTVELDNAKTSLNNISARQTSYSEQLQGMASDIETIPQEQVATQLLALQTRLQASYQATSMIAHLSLVNYLPNG